MLGTSLHTLVQMVENRIGMPLLPQMAIDAGILTNTAIETRALASPDAKRTVPLAWRPSSPRADKYRLPAKALITAADAAHKTL